LTVSRSTEAGESFADFLATTVLTKTLLLQWVPWRRLCQRKKCVIRVVYSRRIGASPFSKSGLFHAPPMQKSRESVVALDAARFGINPILLIALPAELLLDGPRPVPHRRILDRGLVGKRHRPGACPALDEVQVLPRPERIGLWAEVRHIDDKGVPLPVAARVAEPLTNARRQMSASVHDDVALPALALADVVSGILSIKATDPNGLVECTVVQLAGKDNYG
jgi:hypothetical protein